MSTEHKVLISGAGPVGLFTALKLARNGVPVVVFEAESELCPDYRAAGWNAPTADMFENVGALDELLAKGAPALDDVRLIDIASGSQAQMIGDEILVKDGTVRNRGFSCAQPNVVQIFHDILLRCDNTQCLMSHRVLSAKDTPEGVTVEVETPDGKRTFQGSWLIGTDGARSAVRGAMGASMEGYTHEDRFLIMEVNAEDADFHKRYGRGNILLHEKGWKLVMMLPEGDGTFRWRICIPIPNEVSDEEVVTDQFCEKVLQETMSRPGGYKINERRTYNVHQRTATTFRKGRMLLAGDAAHLNNPIGGMGCNSGIHDADDLVDKLLKVMRNEAGEELLDLYDRQRRLANIHVIQLASAGNKSRMEKNPWIKRKLMILAMRVMKRIPALERKMAWKTSMLDSLEYAANVK